MRSMRWLGRRLVNWSECPRRKHYKVAASVNGSMMGRGRLSVGRLCVSWLSMMSRLFVMFWLVRCGWALKSKEAAAP